MKYPNGIAWSGLLESLKDKLARKTLWTSLNTLKDSRLVWQDSEGHWRSDNFLSKQALFVNEVRDAVSGFQNVSVVNHNPLFFEDVPGLPEAFRPVLMDQRYVSPEETSAASWVESSSDMEEWKDKGAYYRIKTSMGRIHSLAEA